MFPRLYHTTAAVYNITKQGARLAKMLNPKAKRNWYKSQNILPTVKSLTKTHSEPGKPSSKRVVVLNKLFMKYITDLMSTGSLSLDILGRGIEISKVKITSDFQILNVYWVLKGTAEDAETESILNNIAGALRHELSTLRLMGEVPYIVFVKDKQASEIVELDKRLAIADYGEDYTPTEIGHMLKSEFVSNSKLSPEIKAKIKSLEESEVFEDNPLPEMTNMIYGLDHERITNRLLAVRKIKQDAWERIDKPDNLISYRASAGTTVSEDNEKQSQQLTDFLQKRKILQDKLHKEVYDRRPQMEVYKQLQQEDDDDDDFDDYFDEDEYDFDDNDDYDDASKKVK